VAYNAMLSSIVDYSGIVSSKGMKTNPGLIFKANDKALKLGQEKMKVSYGKYKAIGR